MRFIKPIIGCLIVVISLAGLIYWESEGRARWTMEEVAVAAADIELGTEVDGTMFRRMRVPKDNLIKGALRYSELPKLAGKISDRPIDENSQISLRFFDEKGSRLEEGKSIFVLKPDWIDMRSSSLRAGDEVGIYSDAGDVYFGEYKIAFVKDDNEQEVVAADGVIRQENILDRRMSSRAPNHVEIIATLEEYEAMTAFVRQEGRGLLIMQKGDF